MRKWPSGVGSRVGVGDGSAGVEVGGSVPVGLRVVRSAAVAADLCVGKGVEGSGVVVVATAGRSGLFIRSGCPQLLDISIEIVHAVTRACAARINAIMRPERRVSTLSAAFVGLS